MPSTQALGAAEADKNKICKLCRRELPIFFFENNEHIKRMPFAALTPLLSQMKDDLDNKKTYLKKLKVSTKFV